MTVSHTTRLLMLPLSALAISASPICAGAALAQVSERSDAKASVTVEQLQDELARRDALIVELLNRVRALEGNAAPATLLGERAFLDAELRPRSPPPVPQAPQGPLAAPQVDELAAERALERSLVREGASLLRQGRVDVNLGAGYARAHRDFPAAITTSAGAFVGERDVVRDKFDLALGLNVGLPYDSQLELFAPYTRVRQRTTGLVGGALALKSERTGSGFGDLDVGLAKTLFSDARSQTRLVGRVTWTTGSGEATDNAVSLEADQPAISAQLSGSWGRDPVVFLAGAAYTHYLPHHDVRQADAYGLSLGAALAISPESALTFSLNQSYSGPVSLGGLELAPDALSTSFNFTASTLLRRGTYLSIRTSMGLTSDAPDYQLGVSVSAPLSF